MVESAWTTAVTYTQNKFPPLEKNKQSAHLPLIDNLRKADVQKELIL